MDTSKTTAESPDTRLRRLRMRSWRRGMKEMDLILGGFADTHLADLSVAELDDHENLMNQPDPEIYSWISGSMPTPPEFSGAIERIIAKLSLR